MTATFMDDCSSVTKVVDFFFMAKRLGTYVVGVWPSEQDHLRMNVAPD